VTELVLISTQANKLAPLVKRKKSNFGFVRKEIRGTGSPGKTTPNRLGIAGRGVSSVQQGNLLPESTVTPGINSIGAAARLRRAVGGIEAFRPILVRGWLKKKHVEAKIRTGR
jgi:hypothetical protein